MKKAQITLEAFLAFAIASIIIVWFSNFAFYHNYETKRIAVFQQQKNIANSIAGTLQITNITKTSIQFSIPCIYDGPSAPIAYNISLSPNNVKVITPRGEYNVSASAVNNEIRILQCPVKCTISNNEVICEQ